MASKLGGDQDDIIADINITPFVDIVLVVLIIFMVTATYIVKQSIKVTLAAALATPHGKVIGLIDLVKQEGVVKFAINIDPMQTPPETITP